MGRRHLKTGEVAAIRPHGQGLGKGGRQGQQPERRRTGQGQGAPEADAPLQLEHAVHPLVATIRRSSTAPARSCSARSTAATICKIISPEITLTKSGSGTAIAESPKNPDVLWAGTDDGALWVTRNGGKDWTNHHRRRSACPARAGLRRIEASRTVEGRAYVAFDAHRSDDDKPYLFVTEDFGETWKNITEQPARVRLDALSARGRGEPGPALLRHRVRRLCVA